MHAYHLSSFHAIEGLSRSERPRPQPGAGQVLVKIHARSLNYRDLLILDQQYAVPARPSVIPLSDGAGEVVEVGDGVSGLAAGDRVAATYFPRWQAGLLSPGMAIDQFGCTRDGMLAEFVVAEEAALVKIPGHLSFEEASTLPCAGLTAWSAVTTGRSLLPGETVLTIGTGGVALFALQFAKLLGARVIAVTSSKPKAALLERLGADAVVNRSQFPDWSGEVRRHTGGQGVDRVVETGAIDTLPQSLASCGANAELSLVAALGAGALDAAALRGLVTMRRLFVGSRAGFEAMNRAVEHHRLRPVIDRTFGFDEARSAYQYFAARQHIGKVVIAGGGDP